jgi:signal transduction histidine kinase
VEANELYRFYSQVSTWPKSKTEADGLAERIAKLLQVEFVGLYSQGKEGEDFQAFGAYSAQSVNRQGFTEVIREQFKLLSTQSFQPVYQAQVSSQRYSLLGLIKILYFSKLIASRSQVQSNQEERVIVVGSSRSLNSQDETLFIAILQRLIDLIQMAEFESEVQIRNQFLSIASHELKTPLTSIYGILQLQERMLRLKKEKEAAEGFPEQERHHSFLKMVIRQVERLNELIDGLLDVSRIQNGRFMVEPTETDVGTLLRDTVQARLQVIAKEASVNLNVDGVQSLLAQVDPVRMEEVISNLIMNAIRFSPEGGVIWIKLRNDDTSFRLTVRDQGPSIPMEDRERIFQPFERAPRTSRMGGLGLGLFISRQIALLHGGNVSLVESIPGKGNVFEAYFPKRSADLASA